MTTTIKNPDEFQSFVNQFLANRKTFRSKMKTERIGQIESEQLLMDQSAITNKPILDKLSGLDQQLQTISSNTVPTDEQSLVVQSPVSAEPGEEKMSDSNIAEMRRIASEPRGPLNSFELRNGNVGREGYGKIMGNTFVLGNKNSSTVVKRYPLTKGLITLLHQPFTRMDRSNLTPDDVEAYKEIMTLSGLPTGHGSAKKYQYFWLGKEPASSNTPKQMSPRKKTKGLKLASHIINNQSVYERMNITKLKNVAKALGIRRYNPYTQKTKQKLLEIIKRYASTVATPYGDEEHTGSGVISSPDQGCSRLQLLVGSQQAGNSSKVVKNEISDILDYLLKEGCVSQSDHRQMFQSYVE